jgi:hypothetical protein
MKMILPLFLFTGLFLFSCASEKPALPPAEEPAVEEPAVEEEITEPAVEEPAAEEETPAEVTAPEEVGEEDSYTVSQELYEQTFEEIEMLIKELNQVISKKQYDRWLKYLSINYIRKYNSTEILNEINEYPQMKDNGIVLKDLRGYFDWVVVPSRSRAVLGEIVFVGETQVIAYSSFEGKRAKLYELEKIDDKWKITVWD